MKTGAQTLGKGMKAGGPTLGKGMKAGGPTLGKGAGGSTLGKGMMAGGSTLGKGNTLGKGSTLTLAKGKKGQGAVASEEGGEGGGRPGTAPPGAKALVQTKGLRVCDSQPQVCCLCRLRQKQQKKGVEKEGGGGLRPG